MTTLSLKRDSAINVSKRTQAALASLIIRIVINSKLERFEDSRSLIVFEQHINYAIRYLTHFPSETRQSQS